MMQINRERAAALGQETLRICEAGFYITPQGTRVELRALLEHAVGATVSYPPELRLPLPASGRETTVVVVCNESTLTVARRLIAEGRHVAALNFASARHPGGGFLSGARAQEESLARASGLYLCLHDNPMYALHERLRDPLYTDYAIYSPGMPVFRADDGALLDAPYPLALITAPAVNATVVHQRDPSRRGEIRAAMARRVAKVLSIAAAHQHDALVLGAWGCGVFGNQTAEIAALFQAALSGPFADVFAVVVFAILDWSPEERFIGLFQRAFPGSAG
jgi:uncharacterized protein (TIGR02452 family)